VLFEAGGIIYQVRGRDLGGQGNRKKTTGSCICGF